MLFFEKWVTFWISFLQAVSYSIDTEDLNLIVTWVKNAYRESNISIFRLPADLFE